MLTGSSRYRGTWRGKLVLQVEVTDRWFVMFKGWQTKTYWRDANIKDSTILPDWESRRKV